MKLLLVLALVFATLIGLSWAIVDEVKKDEVVGMVHPPPEPELFPEEGRPVDVAKPVTFVLDHDKDKHKESWESDEMIRSRRECDRRYQKCYRDCDYDEYEKHEGRRCMRRCEREYYDCLEQHEEYRPWT